MTTYIKVFSRLVGSEWIRQFVNENGIWKWVVDTIPDERQVKLEDEEIEPNELVRILNRRISERQTGITAVFGEPDFLPFAFLARGLRCGAAVCRLVRRYGDVGQLIQTIEELEGRRQVKFTVEELTEMLCINATNKLSDEEKKNFFADYPSCPSKALTPEKLQTLMPIPFATGFLVGKNYLLTNHHVIASKEHVKEFIAEFNYETDIAGQDREPIQYALDDSLFYTNPDLDFTLVKVHSKPLQGKPTFDEAGDNFGWLTMQENPDVIAPPYCREKAVNLYGLNPIVETQLGIADLAGEPVNIIQHPKGRRKEVVLYSNRVQEIYKNFLRYEADADFGSSGSPVMNQQWQLVALHHAALAEQVPTALTKKGKQAENSYRIVGQLGVRICKIVEDLKQQESLEIQQFLNTYVLDEGETVPKNYPTKARGTKTRGRIFISGSRDRNISVETYREIEILNALRDRIVSLLSASQSTHGFEIHPVPDDKSGSLTTTIEWINQQGYSACDVALDILTDSLPEHPDIRGASVYYIASKTERKMHAELLLQKLLSRVRELPSLGAKPDRAAETGRLAFCRNILMPSLVMYIGYLTNEQDRKLMSDRTEAMARGIAEGLIAWSESLCPVPRQSDKV